MKITILDKSQIKYNGHFLTEHQTYNDIDDKTAQELLASGEAKRAADEIAGVSFSSAPEAQQTPKFDKEKNGGFVGEAVLTPEQKAKLAEENKVDTTPVVGQDNTLPKDTTPEPEVKTEVLGADGKPLSDEEIAKQQQQAAAQAPAGDTDPDKVPSVAEVQNAGTVVTP